MSKEVGAGGRFDIFLDSAFFNLGLHNLLKLFREGAVLVLNIMTNDERHRFPTFKRGVFRRSRKCHSKNFCGASL